MAHHSIYHSSFVDISKKDESDYLFKFTKSGFDELFFTSLPIDAFIIDRTETSAHINYTLRLQSVQTLPQLLSHHKQRLSYQLSKLLLLTLGEQFSYLERNNKIILSINPHDIIVLSDRFFLYMEPQGMYTITRGDNVVIDTPPKKSPFFSPELAAITSIPSNVHKNSWMYSIASLVGFYLTNNSRFHTAIPKNTDTRALFLDLLESIQDTPVAFCLLRCVAYNPHERVYLYI